MKTFIAITMLVLSVSAFATEDKAKSDASFCNEERVNTKAQIEEKAEAESSTKSAISR